MEKLEKANHLPEGSAQRFIPIVGFRNRIVHPYDRVDPKIVYDILKNERADLEKLGELLIKCLKK